MKKAPFKSPKNFWATGAEHWVHDFFLRATNGRPYKGLGVRTQSAASACKPHRRCPRRRRRTQLTLKAVPQGPQAASF